MVSQAIKQSLREISLRIVEAQRPIRILDAIKWDDSIEQAFYAGQMRQMPAVDAAYYQNIPLNFDPESKLSEFTQIITDIHKTLGDNDDLGELLTRTCEQYMDVVHMLSHRGTKKFWEYSARLYGSPSDRFFADCNDIVSLGKLLYDILSQLDDSKISQPIVRDITSEDAVRILTRRFAQSFLAGKVEVILSDGIVADAAAGSNYIKIRQGALFSSKDIDVLEVHEGWSHVATTANGANQSTALWLSKGPPRCAITQEGLAVLMEVITFRSYPRRVRKINNRLLGIAMAEGGANALELFKFYQDRGYSIDESYRSMMRVCRGGMVSGGAPFTKDISYCQGFIENYNFIRTAIRKGRPELIRFLFAGKVHVRDVPLIYQKHLEGIVDAPTYLPPPFTDLSGLAVWMSFSNYLNQVDLKKVQDDYDALFERFV